MYRTIYYSPHSVAEHLNGPQTTAVSSISSNTMTSLGRPSTSRQGHVPDCNYETTYTGSPHSEAEHLNASQTTAVSSMSSNTMTSLGRPSTSKQRHVSNYSSYEPPYSPHSGTEHLNDLQTTAVSSISSNGMTSLGRPPTSRQSYVSGYGYETQYYSPHSVTEHLSDPQTAAVSSMSSNTMTSLGRPSTSRQNYESDYSYRSSLSVAERVSDPVMRNSWRCKKRNFYQRTADTRPKGRPLNDTKLINCVFLNCETIPAPFSKKMVLGVGQIAISSSDSEISIRSRLNEIVSRVCRRAVEEIQLDFLSYFHRELYLPATISVPYEWNGSRLKRLVGQGRLYCQIHFLCDPNENEETKSVDSAVDCGDRHSDISEQHYPGAASPNTSENDSTDDMVSDDDDDDGDEDMENDRGAADTYDELFNAPVPLTSDSDSVCSVSYLSNVNDTHVTVKDILENLAEPLKRSDDTCVINVCRSDVLGSFKRAVDRKRFNPEHILYIKFTDDDGENEGAVDLGGPRREFLHLVLKAVSVSPIFNITPSGKLLSNLSHLIEGRDYYIAGVAMALSLVHGGPNPSFLSPHLFEAIVHGPEKCTVGSECIPDQEIVNILKLLLSAPVPDKFKLLNEQPLCTLVDISGCTELISIKTQEQCEKGVADLCNWYVFGRTRAAFEQFKEGLTCLNVLNALQQHPQLFKPLMCKSQNEIITSTQFDNLFTIKRSEAFSNRAEVENVIIGYWRDLLMDVEDGEAKLSDADLRLTFESILMFSTGSEVVPALGFETHPTIEFLHDENSDFPKASTCSCILYLPVNNQNYDSFKKKMIFGILNTKGFGYE